MFNHQRRRQGHGGFGAMMLAMNVMQIGLENIPPITLGLVVLNSVVFFNPPLIPGIYFGHAQDACISGEAIVYGLEFQRIWLSAFFHLNDMHLYYNMSSLLWKGRLLETRIGSESFLQMITVLVTLSSAIYVAMGWVLMTVFGMPGYFYECAAGFSSVLFALKVVLQTLEPGRTHRVMGMPFPVGGQWAYWAELVLIQVLVPGTSLLGHLSGILAGLLYTADALDGVFATVRQLTGRLGPPRRRYNDVVGHAVHSPAGTVRDVTRSTDSRDGFARASRSMDGPPHTTPGGRTDGGANGAPEGAWLVQGVVQPSAPPPSVYEAQQRASHELHHRTPHHGSTADVDPDTVRSARLARFGAPPATTHTPDTTRAPERPRFWGSGNTGR